MWLGTLLSHLRGMVAVSVLGCRDGGRWWVSSKTCLLGLLAWPATLVTYGATVCMRAVGLFVCLGVALCFERCRVSGGLEDSCVL